MPANTAAHRATDEAETTRSSPPGRTKDLQPSRWLLRLPKPDRQAASLEAPRMDWLQALIVAGGAAVIAYHVGFRHGHSAAPDRAENEPALRQVS